ncbi:hypothetical protein E8E11_003333 [Didymella keratinophila]|nr:hypothetical protein E8E11_003333 [Didymella keratinophila]
MREHSDEKPPNKAEKQKATTRVSQDQTRLILPPVSSEAWQLHKQKMSRFNTAVKRATAVSTVESDGKEQKEKLQHNKPAINLSFGDGIRHLIPWEACCAWKGMEAFLQEWFADDESAQDNLKSGSFVLMTDFESMIHPTVWHNVIRPNMNIEFSFQLPTGISNPPTTVDPKIEDVTETKYENRVQYKVKYYRRVSYTQGKEFVRESTYSEPVQLEVADTFDTLPVLEERKDVTSEADISSSGLGLRFGAGGLATRMEADVSKTTPSKLQPTDTVSEAKLQVHSPYLHNILKAVIEYSTELPGTEEQGLESGVFTYPYRDLYHHLDDLLAYKSEGHFLRAQHSTIFNQTADQHIDLLRRYLEDHPTIPFEEAKTRWSRSIPLTTFGTFWLIMKPGIDVYVREADGSLSRCVLDRLTGGITHSNMKSFFVDYTAWVWNLMLDEKGIRQNPRKVEIHAFDDERSIVELPVFPASFYDAQDGGALSRSLTSRGKKYFSYSSRPCFLQYSGHGLKPGSRSYQRARVIVEHASRPWSEKAVWGTGLEQYTPASSKPVDPFAYPTPLEYGSTDTIVIGQSIREAECECKECAAAPVSQETYTRLKFDDYKNIDPVKVIELSEHQYRLLPSHMFAFILKDRAYDLLDVANLEEPKMADTAIERLVIRPGNKQLIKAVAKTYTDNSKVFSADFIYGKGEGQIILLHGPPESVAEFTKRPLLSITAADLGHEPSELEKSLLQYFRRANDWDAIVLLDEADVYLEKRTNQDLKRNSIVSVFLRALDYFQGILFLTTNRVGSFDEAFMSRIHLSLQYDELGPTARQQIWENLFQKLKDDYKSGGTEIRYEREAKAYVLRDKEVAALKWNGREIRNAFQTAVALAVYDAKHGSKGPIPEITEKHLEQVVEMSAAFKEYVKATHGKKDHSRIAYEDGVRDDRVLAAFA